MEVLKQVAQSKCSIGSCDRLTMIGLDHKNLKSGSSAVRSNVTNLCSQKSYNTNYWNRCTLDSTLYTSETESTASFFLIQVKRPTQLLKLSVNNPIKKEVNVAETNDETRSFHGEGTTEFSSAGSSKSSTRTSEEVARQIRAVTDPLSNQLELMCDLMRNLRLGITGI